jgi:hypothetical protein
MSREAAESLRFMPCVHEATASNEVKIRDGEP